VSWSEFAAGTIQAQLGYFEGESERLNFAGTRVRSVPGEGLEPSRGKPSQDFKSCAAYLLLRYRSLDYQERWRTTREKEETIAGPCYNSLLLLAVMESRLSMEGLLKKLRLMLSVKRSPNEAGKRLDAIPGTISGTVGQFEQSVDSISPLESIMRP